MNDKTIPLDTRQKSVMIVTIHTSDVTRKADKSRGVQIS